jgi:alginate O-acetyltransferase complex protein AlgI
MAFNSLIFVFLFGPLFFVIFYASPIRRRNLVCLLQSLIFYAWAEPIFIFIAVTSSVLDYWLVGLLAPMPPGRTKHVLTLLAVAQGVLILLYFKYAAFLYGAVAGLIGIQMAPPSFLSPALPLAVSFVTFEKITYVVDNYRGIGRPARSLLDYLAYVFLFPKLIAGPIVRYHDIEPYLTNHAVRIDDFRVGVLRFALGMSKKVLIADSLAGTVEAVFRTSPDALASGNAWLGVICFSFQLYFDFSGYSDMAIGMARMMGFPLRENFNQPYLATNFTDFWHRWNISLSTWIRDYLYVPLGGNRVPAWRLYLNLITCFVLSGLWHGANWTFLLWGLYHGAFLVADRVGLAQITRALPTVINVAATFFFVTIGWVLFRSPDVDHARRYFHAMVDFNRDLPSVVFLDQNTVLTLGVAALMSFTPESWLRALTPSGALAKTRGTRLSWLVVLAFIWACSRLAATTSTPFLYFRF